MKNSTSHREGRDETGEWIGIEDWLTVLSGFFTVVLVLYLFGIG